MLRPEQRYIRAMMLMGLIASVLTLSISWCLAPLFLFDPLPHLSIRVWVFVWSLLIGSLPLFAFIALIAFQRFFGTSISGDHSDSRVEIGTRVLNNTHEQFTLLIVVLALLVSGLPEVRLAMAPCLAIAFNIYRAIFWFGYQKRPKMRAFGFEAGFYMNILGAVLSIALLLSLI